MSYVDRIKTDPVMNAVFNSNQKKLRYTTREVFGYDPTDDQYWWRDEYTHYDPARNPGPYLLNESLRQMPAAAAWGLPHIVERGGVEVEILAGGDPFRARLAEPTEVYRRNPDLYWINMLPKDLYNINYINKPNPIIGSLKNLPVHISTLHPSFA